MARWVGNFETRAEWLQLQFEEQSDVQDVYGFSSTKGLITVEGVRYVPDRPSKTLLIYMHPASTQTIVPVPKAMAKAGFHVLAAGSRYTRNDTTLVMEKILRDLQAYVEHARMNWGYEKIVLAGWSGGGSFMMFYQRQAECPSITETPAGDPFDVRALQLTPADGVIFHAAHVSRANVLLDCIDPSVLDESNPDVRDPELDLYSPVNPNVAPYTAEFIVRFRAAQRHRMAARTKWVRDVLLQLKTRRSDETERGFITHRTMADPRFLDPTLDPNDRQAGMSFLGKPQIVNTAAAGLARFSTLRSWLSQWSVEDTNTNAIANAAKISVPLLALENSADDAVLGPQVKAVFDAAPDKGKQFHVIEGANHYYAGQPNHLQIVARHYEVWLEANGLLR